jgi:hypothetical protein
MKEEIELSANTHRELRDHDSEIAPKTARKFFEHRRESETLIQSIFEANLVYGTAHGQSA